MTRKQFFLSTLKQHGDSDECLLWPYWIHHGYGRFEHSNQKFLVHRESLALKLNRSLKENALACHTCRNRNCYNPKHLYEGTHKTNYDDAVREGTIHVFERKKCSSVIAMENIPKIRDEYISGIMGYKKLAKKYNTTRHTVRALVKGYIWKNV